MLSRKTGAFLRFEPGTAFSRRSSAAPETRKPAREVQPGGARGAGSARPGPADGATLRFLEVFAEVKGLRE